MEVTAVEWVLQYLKNVKPNEFCSIEKIKELLEQAKELEQVHFQRTPCLFCKMILSL